MTVKEVYSEIKLLIKDGKGDYEYVNHRGMVAEEVHKVVVDVDKKQVSII